MTDIVERLRSEVSIGSGTVTPLRKEAADEIERLRAALEDVCNYGDLAAVRIARAALKGQS